MATFSITGRNGGTIAAWELNPGTAGTASREREPVAVEETQHVGFLLDASEPEWEYAIQVGDRGIAGETGAQDPMHESVVRRFGSVLCWYEAMHFESARGWTTVHLNARSGAERAWQAIGSFQTYVLPSKLGEQRYDAMAGDLRRLCGGLLLDLLGTSRHSLQELYLARGLSYRSKEEELRAVQDTWHRLQPLLDRIARSPSAALVRDRAETSYWGGGSLGQADLRQLARRGVDPRDPGVLRPLRMTRIALRETTDTGEHRAIVGFVRLLVRRLAEIAKAISQHRSAIQAEMPYRDMRIGDRPSLYDLIDVPKLRQLETADRAAKELYEDMRRVLRSLPFRDCTPDSGHPSRHLFTQGVVYRSVRDAMDRFLLAAQSWTGEDAGDAITKLSSRMYEQWVMLGLVEAFRTRGLQLAMWNEVLKSSVGQRFTIDFERGLEFRAALTPHKILRIRYEPWILCREDARQTRETLCHGAPSRMPWCPDIVVECVRSRNGVEESLYGIAIDCKYSLRVVEHHWAATRKYTRIRATANNRQVMRQLWIAYPGEDAEIRMVDPALDFAEGGPTCPVTETVEGTLACMPGTDASQSVLDRFAGSLLNYLRGIPIDTMEEQI